HTRPPYPVPSRPQITPASLSLSVLDSSYPTPPLAHSLYRLSSPILAPPLGPPFAEGEPTELPWRLENRGAGREWSWSGLPFHGLRRIALVLLVYPPPLLLPHRIHTLDPPLGKEVELGLVGA
ncbi:unnamed protein product, partial [Urochloa humidicola]